MWKACESGDHSVFADRRTGCVYIDVYSGKRAVPIDLQFFQGNGETCLKLDELIVSVFLPFSKEVSINIILYIYIMYRW